MNLNIERGLNSKISLRAVHRTRSVQAPAFERERWVLRDRNIYLRACEGKREREGVRERGRKREEEKAKQKRRREMVKENERVEKGRETAFLFDPEKYIEKITFLV